jgi:hypothetical protein
VLRMCEHSKEAQEKTCIHVDVHLSVEITQDLADLINNRYLKIKLFLFAQKI